MSDSVGSVSVDVVPDARGWSEKLRAQIRDQTVTINADADTGEAEAQLDEVARTRTAKVKADVSQLSQGASKLDQFVGNLGLIPSLAIAAGAALIPLGAALAGVTAAIGAPLAIAGGGATLFGVLAGFAVKETNDQLKNIAKIQTKLDGLKKGTQEYADAQKELKAQQDALSPAQVRFSDSLGKVKGAFDGLLQGKTGQALLAPLASGLDLIAKVLPGLAPIIQAVSGAISDLIGELSDAVDGPGFKKFVRTFAHDVGPDIKSFGHIAGNVIGGLTGFIGALDGSLSGGVLHNLERLSGNFKDLGDNAHKSKGLQDFVDYFHRVGPQVAHTLGSLATSVGHIVEALAPLGPPTLHVIQGIADAFNSIPIPVLTGIAAATAGLVAFQKVGGLKATSFAANKLTGGKGILGGLVGAEAIQKVYVVNLPPAGLAGGPGGVAGTAGKSVIGAEAATGAAAASKSGLLTKLGLGEIIGAALSAPALLSLVNNKANENPNIYNQPKYLTGRDFRQQFAGATTVPGSDVLSQFGKHGFSQDKARSLLNIPDIKASSTAVDGLRANLGRASRQIDLVGAHASASFGAASHDVSRFKGELAGIHDVKFKVIAQTQSAISSLERLQALRIADKSFTVYQRNQLIEQTVGPGGGIGRYPGNPGPTSGSGGGAVGKRPVTIHLDDNGKRVLTGHMEDTANRVYDANSAYDAARAGQ